MISSLISPLSRSLIKSLSFIDESGLPVFHAPLLIDDRPIPSIIPRSYTGPLSRYVTKWDGDLKFFSRSSVPLAPMHGTDYSTDAGGDTYIKAPVDYANQMKGYSGEPERTNSLLYSNDLSNIYWSKTDVNIVASTIAAPDGSLTAKKITRSGPTGLVVTTAVGAFNGQRKSIWARTISGVGKVSLLAHNSVSSVLFNLTDEWTDFSSDVDTSQAAGSFFYVVDFRNPSVTLTDVLIWEAQIETGTYTTSVIKTSGAPATRISDNLEYDISNKNILNNNLHSVYFEASKHDIATEQVHLYGVNYKVSITDDDMTYLWDTGETVTFLNTSFNDSLGHQIGFTYDGTNCKLFIDGVLEDTQAASFTTGATRTILRIGAESNSTELYSKHTKDVKVWNRTLSEAEMINETTPQWGAGFESGGGWG